MLIISEMNMDVSPLAKKSGESDYEYHKRLVYGKLKDKTLAEYDYAELSDYVYGDSLSSTETRKRMYGSMATLDLLEQSGINNISDDTIISEIKTQQIELKKEAMKFQDQRREFNKLLRQDSRSEHLRATIESIANKIADEKAAYIDEEQFFPEADFQKEAILVLSDWHYGMVTNNIFNKYNTDICINRVSKTINKAIDKLVVQGCSKLNVLVLGDLFHGSIHTSARVASEELVCDQIMHASELLAQSIETLSEFVPSVDVYLTYGNHARTIQNKEDSIHRDNLERLVRWWLEPRLSNLLNVKVMPESETELITLRSFDYVICASHGDIDSVGTAPKVLNTLFEKKFGHGIDYVILGDKHHRESFEELGITSMISGALCGSDDYANNRRLYATPSQLLLFFNKDGLDAEYRLKCD